jgi:hypothetical protein
MFNFGFGQKALNDKFKKIIIDTEKKHDAKVSEYGIDNKLWTDNTASFKENDTISFYTTSNLPFCKSKLFVFYPKNSLTINYGDECNEPPSISVAKIKYRYKIRKDLLTAFSSNKNIICRLRIVKIENYQQDKYGKDSYKLTFIVLK